MQSGWISCRINWVALVFVLLAAIRCRNWWARSCLSSLIQLERIYLALSRNVIIFPLSIKPLAYLPIISLITLITVSFDIFKVSLMQTHKMSTIQGTWFNDFYSPCFVFVCIGVTLQVTATIIVVAIDWIRHSQSIEFMWQSISRMKWKCALNQRFRWHDATPRVSWLLSKNSYFETGIRVYHFWHNVFLAQCCGESMHRMRALNGNYVMRAKCVNEIPLLFNTHMVANMPCFKAKCHLNLSQTSRSSGK